MADGKASIVTSVLRRGDDRPLPAGAYEMWVLVNGEPTPTHKERFLVR